MKACLLLLCLLLPLMAAAQTKTAPRRYINLPNRPAQGLPFADAALAGDTLYISGRIGVDPKTGVPPKDLNEEIRILLDGFRDVLAAAGMNFDNLVMVQVFCPDLGLYDQFNAAYRERFRKDFPARAFIGSGPLLRGGHFEMLGIARK
jgi:2-iminobutanoate/2-iminopropanoate deaminase